MYHNYSDDPPELISLHRTKVGAERALEVADPANRMDFKDCVYVSEWEVEE